jgi:hypothetical protein
MPKEYTEIRDAYVAKGKPLAEAKSIAAATWNKRHPKDTNPWKREAILRHLTKR